MNSILSTTLQPQQWPGTIWALLLTTAATVFYKVFWRPAFPKNAPKWYKKGDWPILGSVEYYYGRRLDFVREALRNSKTGNFSFYIGKKQMIGVSGPAGRKVFFESKDLNFPQAYVSLFSICPSSYHVELLRLYHPLTR
jgi:sterol 14-demethylase